MSFDLGNPQAGYVLAAYGIAVAGLLGLLFASWRAARQRQRELEKLEQKRAGN